MSDSKVSQVREAAQGAWKKAADDQVARLELGYAEVARMQEQGLEQARHAVDELGKLTKDSFGYMFQLSAEWRKLTLEAARKTAEIWSLQG